MRASRHWLTCLALCIALGGCARETARLGAETVAPGEDEIAERMWQSIATTMRARAAAADGVLRRFNQAKSLGCFDAEFTVLPGLETDLAQGLFARPARHPAVVRVAAASKDDDREKDVYGLSISVRGIEAQRTLNGAASQDFVLNSHPALFAADPEDFLAFVEAVEDDALLRYFLHPLDPHPKSLLVLLQARTNPRNPFAIRYFSTTPYRHGDDQSVAVKHAVAPCGSMPRVDDADHEHRLRDAMTQHLDAGPACFDFLVQFQTDAAEMPIEDASVVWSEELSPFRPVARLTITNQNFTSADALDRCERLSFNPWNALPAHRPLGGINRVRRSIYSNAAQLRAAGN